MAKYELVVTSDDALSSPLTLTVLNSVGPRGPAGPAGPTGPAGATTFGDLTDVDSSGATVGQLLQADGDDTFSFVTVAGATNTLDDVTDNGNTTTNSISVGGITATSLNTHTIPSGTGTLAKTSDIPTNNNQLTNGAGYLTAESDTLDSVTDRGSSTTNGVTVGSLNTHTIPGGTGTLALTSDVPTNNNQLTNGAGYITDYTVTQGDVTAHQAALSITESQISDLGTYLTAETNDLSSAVTWANVPNANITQSSVTQHQAALSITESQISDLGTYIPTSQKGAASGVASLDSSGLVPTNQLPSYVDDVLEYTNYSSFPASGETGKIYVDLATGDIYRWSGSAYVQINNAVSSADQATQLATARTISLGGDVSGSTSFDGTADVTITATVADDSHNHTIANVDGLQTALDGKLATTATTDDVSEGSTNLYHTDTRARGAITLTSSNTNELSYNGSTGEFSYTSPSTVSQSTAVTLDVRNTTGSTIAKGVPVYIAGHSGQKVLVAPADANDSTKMPAIGLASSAINNNNNGTVTSFGLVAAINTSSFSVGDTLYIDTTPGGTSFGGLTNSPPTGETSAIQNIGKVARSDISQGEIVVSGPGRSNDTPNLDNGDIFIGNASNQAITSSLNTEVSSIVDKTFVDALNVDADTLDGNDSAYYLNASNISTGTLASARLPDLAVSDFAGAAIVTEAEGLNSSDNDTSIPTTAAVKDYVDGTGSVANDSTITIAAGTGLSNGGDFTTNQGTAETITINHTNSVTAGTVSEGGIARTLSYGGSFNVPSVTYDAQGHVTGTTTTALQLPASDNTDTTYTAGDGLTLTGTDFDVDLTDTVTFTSTNTASKAVVRDASGNFAAGTITANLTGTVSSLSNHDTDNLSEGSTNLYYTATRFDSAFGGKDTDDLSEGSTNLYYTDARANTAFDNRLATKTTTNLTEGDNLYHTTERVEDAVANQFVTVGQHTGISFSYDDANDGAIDATVSLGAFSTDNLSEGSTNLYFTNERVDDRVDALITDGTGVTSTYNDVAGTLTLAIGQDVSSGSSVTFAGVTAPLTGNVTGNVTGDVTGNVTSSGTSTFATVDINGGAIDGTAIGANSASTVAATTLTTTGNVTVGGNLTVQGTTTTVNSETLEIADNQIVLNSNYTGSTPSENAGIEVERGTQVNKTLIWHETDDEWTVGSEAFKAGTFKGNLTGNVTSTGTSTFSTVDINGGAIDGTTIGTTTPSTIAGTTVSASSGFSGDLTGDVTGDLTGNVTGNITSTGTSTFSSIDVNGGAIDGTPIGSTTAAAITGTTITANTGFTGNITSTGTSTFSNIDVNGGAIDNATIGGVTPAAITGTSITANTGFSGPLTGNVTGDVSGNSGTATALQTARTIGGVSFDGTANINLPGVNTTGNQNTTGSAATLTTARTLNLSGVTATGASFDGSANATINVTDVPASLLSGTIASARLPDLAVADFAAAAIVTEAEGLSSSDNDTSIPTTAAVVDYAATTGKAIAMAIVFGG